MWLGHCLRCEDYQSIAKTAFKAQPLENWKRRPGGQKKDRWLVVKNDVELLGGFRLFGQLWDSDWLYRVEAGHVVIRQSLWIHSCLSPLFELVLFSHVDACI